jgi:Fic family protein
MDTIQSAIARKEILDSLRPINAEQEQRIMQKFRLDWNYHSNHIEGNSLSYGETKALILFNITAQGKPLKDHFEIKGHNEAIDLVLDVIKNHEDLTEHFIRQMHVVLLKEPYMSDAVTSDGKPTKKRIEIGKYKTLPNHVKTVTGEIFYFASPEETPAKMHDLMNWYHEKKQREETNPILLAAEFHYRFVRIHPFDDGNGRMARMLMNFILMQYGYPPVIIKTEDKQNYIRALEQADTVAITPFIEYIALNLNYSLDIMIAGARGEDIEEPDDLDKKMQLLEQEINNTSKKVADPRTPKIIKHLLQNSIRKIFEKCREQFGKLSTNYKEVTLRVNIDNSGNPHPINISFAEVMDKVLNDYQKTHLDFKKLMIIYNYTSFLPRNSKAIIKIDSFQNNISIDLFDIYYGLSNALGDKVEKYYDDELTDDEIDRIIKKEVLRHLEFIAQKIKEAEEGSKSK